MLDWYDDNIDWPFPTRKAKNRWSMELGELCCPPSRTLRGALMGSIRAGLSAQQVEQLLGISAHVDTSTNRLRISL